MGDASQQYPWVREKVPAAWEKDRAGILRGSILYAGVRSGESRPSVVYVTQVPASQGQVAPLRRCPDLSQD